MRHSSFAEVQCDAKVLGPSSNVDGESSYLWVRPQQQRPHFKFCQCCFCVHWLRHCTTGLFGVKRYGVHLNGYTVSDSGEVSMWLARRSATKQTYPGLLDNLVSTDCIWHYAENSDNRSCWHCSRGCIITLMLGRCSTVSQILKRWRSDQTHVTQIQEMSHQCL